MRIGTLALAIPAMMALSLSANAAELVSHYDDLDEAFYGETFTYNGLTYRNVNDQPGIFPSGETFTASQTGTFDGLGNTIMVENATLLYNDFPDFGSANNALTFGFSYVVGNNLSLGALSTVWIDLPSNADAASFELAYYENGPWGGIVYHLDGLMGDTVVASDSFTISDQGGRDNIAFNELAISGATFDTLHVYATFGAQYSGPRILMDNLSVNLIVPEPASLSALAGGLLLARRRR